MKLEIERRTNTRRDNGGLRQVIARNLMQLLCCVVCCCCAAVAQPRQLKKETRLGYIPFANGKLQSDLSEDVKLYDREGRILEERDKRFVPDVRKIIILTKRNFYGQANRLDSTLVFSDSTFAMKLEMLCDSAGTEIGVQEYNSDRKKSFRSRYVCDSGKQKTRQEMYSPDGSLFNFKDFKYDKRGNLIDESGSEQGTPRYRWVYKYDSRDRLNLREDYDGKSTLVRKHRYIYNVGGQIARETIFNGRGEIERVMKYVYEYY